MEHVWERVLRQRIDNAKYWHDKFATENMPESAEHWALVAELLQAIRDEIWEKEVSAL